MTKLLLTTRKEHQWLRVDSLKTDHLIKLTINSWFVMNFIFSCEFSLQNHAQITIKSVFSLFKHFPLIVSCFLFFSFLFFDILFIIFAFFFIFQSWLCGIFCFLSFFVNCITSNLPFNKYKKKESFKIDLYCPCHY